MSWLILIICEFMTLGYVGWCSKEEEGNDDVIVRYVLICILSMALGTTFGVMLIIGGEG